MLIELGLRALLRLDPEDAHTLSIKALKTGLVSGRREDVDPRLAVTKAGLDFPNPLGMAAGYDKNAEVPDALLGLGFGFAEVGTVTPRPQTGNPKPRIFRLREEHGVINRLGFNNQGHAAALARLSSRKSKRGIVGVNIGANKDSRDRIADYEAGARAFAPVADYLTVNISSPNTPGLRDLQAGEALDELLARVLAARDAAVVGTPVFLKVAPDLGAAEIDAIADAALRHGIDGIIVSNTTVARNGLTGVHRNETGGLSGRPLFRRSTIALARMRKAVGPEMVLIGAGGVESAETALEKIRAGADLVQLYTGMIYAGPTLPGRVVAGLGRIARDAGLGSITELRDSAVTHWAGQQTD
ncbi:MAG: quinone-dependent dihydroorotate dehydrogenase [Rhizobiaceae bacterium]|nr:quinone-dependent dihydroorotate dehydrogenase [Rhizobiaceae bacterium]